MTENASTEMRVGERIRHYRERRGLTQLAVAAQVGRSENWLWKVENGYTPVDRMSMLFKLKDVLGVRDLSDLTGQAMGLVTTDSPEHDSVADIRAAMSSLPATRGDQLAGPILSARTLAERVADSWTIFETDRARYDRLGNTLPELLGQAHRTARTAQGADAEAAARSLIEVYHLLQIVLRRLGERELAHLAADRALTLSADLRDVPLMGASAWNLGMTLLSRGDGDLALDLARSMISLMTPLPDDAPAEHASVYGGLHLLAAIACARSSAPGESGRGWDYLRDADRIATRLGADRNDFHMCFGPTNTKMHSVHLAGEGGDATEALRLADQVDFDATSPTLPVERTTRYLIEVMQANRLVGDDLGTFYLLQQIERLSPEEIKHYPIAREAVRDLIKRGRPINRREVEGLATRLGVIA